MFFKILQNSKKNISARISFLLKLQLGNLKLSEVATGDVRKNKMFLKISQISQQSPFNKVVVLRTCSFIRKRLQNRCFPVKFAKFLRTTNLKNICERLLLNLFKKGLEHMCFPVNFVNYSGTPILKSTYKRLFLKHHCRRFSLKKLQAWRSDGL